MVDKLTADEIKKFKKLGFIEKRGKEYVLTKKGGLELEIIKELDVKSTHDKIIYGLLETTEKKLGRNLTDPERESISEHYASVLNDVYSSYKKLENYKPKPAAGLFTGYAG